MHMFSAYMTNRLSVLGRIDLELHHAFAASYGIKNAGKENVETN